MTELTELKHCKSEILGIIKHINNSYSCWKRLCEDNGIEFPEASYTIFYNSVLAQAEDKLVEYEVAIDIEEAKNCAW